MWEPSSIRWASLLVLTALYGVIFFLKGEASRGSRALLPGTRALRAFLGSAAFAASILLTRLGEGVYAWGPLFLAVVVTLRIPTNPSLSSAVVGEWRELRRWSAIAPLLESRSSLSGGRGAVTAVLLAIGHALLLFPMVAAPVALAGALPWLFLAAERDFGVNPTKVLREFRTRLRAIGESPYIIVRMKGETVLDREDVRVAWIPKRAISGLQRIEIVLAAEANISGVSWTGQVLFRAEESSHAQAKLRTRFGASTAGEGDLRIYRAPLPRGGGSSALEAFLREATSVVIDQRHESSKGLSDVPSAVERRLPPSSRVELAA